MLYIQDNFLTSDEFQMMSDQAIKHSTKKRNLYENNNGWGESCPGLKNDLTMAYVKFGIWQKDVIDRVKTLLLQFTSNVPPIENIWFNYSQKGYEMTPHRDYTLKSDTIEQLSERYKVFIYAHKVWEQNWGGELCFESQEITPYPNRLVLYTTEEKHWTNPINTDNLRMFYCIRFGFPF